MFDEERKKEPETFDIFWKDLTPECQERLKKFLGGNNGNYDVFPLVTLQERVD